MIKQMTEHAELLCHLDNNEGWIENLYSSMPSASSKGKQVNEQLCWVILKILNQNKKEE